LQVYLDDELQGECYWPHPGEYNLENALAALLAVTAAGVSLDDALSGLATFKGVKRRMELFGDFGGVRLYDDFAHHPTAIRRSVEGMQLHSDGRVLAVLEPRSNTMKMGTHAGQISAALEPADKSWLLQPSGLDWQLKDVLDEKLNAEICMSAEAIVADVVATAEPGDAIVIMSNGSFDGIYGLFRASLTTAFSAPE
jgi:UDP-N-acetylmuramate: L-alanyl-gamma-D-glutamyl-meso-diaminopimelate ligase